MEQLVPVYLMPTEDAQEKKCFFSLRPGFVHTEGFYECNGCGHALIESFDLQKGVIPDEVLEQMRTHANLCSALFPVTVHQAS